MSHHQFTATVQIDVDAETESEARRVAFILMTSATLASRRGRGATGQPKASVTGVHIASNLGPYTPEEIAYGSAAAPQKHVTSHTSHVSPTSQEVME